MQQDRYIREPVGYKSKMVSGGVRVLLCDDHEMFRESIAGRLSYLPDIEVIGEASNGKDAVRLAAELSPDVTVLDLLLPGMGGFEVLARIRAENEGARVLVLTGHDSDADVLGALQEGAAGYVLKDSPTSELVEAIRRVASGLPHVSPDVASRLVRLRQVEPARVLTDREVQVLRLVAEGKKTRQIARIVHLAERTVKHDLEVVRNKLGAKSSSHAVALAVQRGLIRVDDVEQVHGRQP